MIKRATKKPVTIDFVEWDGTNKAEIDEFVGRDLWHIVRTGMLLIPTLESPHEASIGDMIIKGVKGELYPCKPDIFALTYNIEASLNIKDKGE